MVRSNAEVKSNLPSFKTGRSKSFVEYLLVYCPREDCPSHQKIDVRPFLVHGKTWKAKRVSSHDGTTVIYGRTCPYCAKTSSMR